MTEIAATSAPPSTVVGRSLWGDAWARLRANRAAMVSLCYLVLMAVLCVVGPWFVPHNYTAIYSDYVRTPPSLEAYPKADMVKGGLDDVLKRMRVDLKEWKLEDGSANVTVTSTKPVDARYLRYVDRSDTFNDAKVEAKSPDGLEMTFSAAVKQQYFLFGTDNVGRDLLSRTLVAGRISLAIGLLTAIPYGFAVIAMVLVAASVSLRFFRFGGVTRLVIGGVAAGFVLYVATQLSEELGSSGIVNPIVAAWLPAALGAMLGALALLHQEDG